MKEIKVYGTDTCSYCVKIKDFLDSKGLPFKVYPIKPLNKSSPNQGHLDNLKRIKDLGCTTIPQIFIDEKLIGGADETIDYINSQEVAKVKRKLTEHIVAIPSYKLNDYESDEDGIVKDFTLKQEDIILAQREYLETTEAFRQVLPVVVFTYRGLVWAYKRTKSGNEANLHDQVSVAVGGHWDLSDIKVSQFNKSDINVGESVKLALDREIDEEVNINADIVSVNNLCTLAANVTSTDRKHLAIMNRFELSLPFMESSEPDLESIGFVNPKELLEMHETGKIKLETWGLVACKRLIQ